MPVHSPFANIFIAIQQRILSEAPEIVFVDHNFGQLDDYSNGRPPVHFPCALIDFQNWSFENMGSQAQRAEGDVVISLAFAQHGQSHNGQPQQWREAALKYYDLEWKLHKALQTWSPGDDFGCLTRTAVVKDNRPLNVRVRTITYRLAFEDYSACVEPDTVQTPTLEVNG
jgi:hypothetical protein